MKIKKILTTVLTLLSLIFISLFDFGLKTNSLTNSIQNTPVISQQYAAPVAKAKPKPKPKDKIVTFEPSDFFEFGFEKEINTQLYLYIKKGILKTFNIKVIYNSQEQIVVNNASKYCVRLTKLTRYKHVVIKVQPKKGFVWASSEGAKGRDFKTYDYKIDWGIDDSLINSNFFSRSISIVWLFIIGLIVIVSILLGKLFLVIFK